MILISAIQVLQAEKTVKFDFQTSEARAIDVYPSTYIHPLVAEVVVDMKTGRIHDTWNLSLSEYLSRQYPDNDEATLQNLRAYGMFKSSEKHNCDLIVAPTFDIRITDQGATITILGYPANFANWNNATNADYQWIDLEKGKQVDMKQDEEKPKKK